MYFIISKPSSVSVLKLLSWEANLRIVSRKHCAPFPRHATLGRWHSSSNKCSTRTWVNLIINSMLATKEDLPCFVFVSEISKLIPFSFWPPFLFPPLNLDLSLGFFTPKLVKSCLLDYHLYIISFTFMCRLVSSCSWNQCLKNIVLKIEKWQLASKDLSVMGRSQYYSND